MDADGSHRPEDLELLLAAVLDGADVVLGTRWMPGGKTVNWPFRRRLLSRGRQPVRARDALRPAPGHHRWLPRLPGGGPAAPGPRHRAAARATSSRSSSRCAHRDAGLDVREVPITFVEREQGSSKMSQAIVVEAMRRVTVWGLQRRIARLFGRRRPASGAKA